MKFFDYYGNIEEIDPSHSREENLERLRQALRVWRKRQGDKAHLTELYINRALEVFSDPKEYEKFRKDWEEQKAKTAKASPEEEFRQLVYGAAIDGEVTTTEYQMLLGEAKRRGIPKGDAERIIQQTVHAHGVPIGQVETRSSEVPAPDVKPNQFRRKWLAGVAVLGLVVGLVIIAKEPWYEPIAPRPDEIIMPSSALGSVGLDVSAAENRINPSEIEVSVTRLGDGSVYRDVGALPFSNFAFLVTFDFPVREGRADNTETLYKIFDGYVDEKWSRFWIGAYAQEVEWHSEDSSSDDVWGQLGYLPLEIELLDTNRLLVLPDGIPKEGYIDLQMHSPPPYLYVYYDKIAHTAYYYNKGYRIITNPDLDEPEVITNPAQTPELEWTKTFEWEGAMGQEPHVQQTSDGGFILVGSDQSLSSLHAVLIKTDANGNERWTKTFANAWGNSVEQSSDGGYVLCGTKADEPFTIWLTKTDSNGSPAWDTEFISPDARIAHGVCAKQATDGGYIVLGGEYFGDESAHRVILIKTDAYGHREWEKIFQGSDYELEGRALLQALDGGYVIAGYKSTDKVLGGWLMKTDAHGDVTWDKTYGGDSMMFNSICQASDGSYLAAGEDCRYEQQGGCVADVWLVNADASGNVQWERTFGLRDDDERCRAIAGASDGGCIVVAYPSGIFRSTWLIKTDASGKKQWEKMLNMYDCFLEGGSVQQTLDGGVIVAGTAILRVEPGAGPYYAAFLMKLK